MKFIVSIFCVFFLSWCAEPFPTEEFVSIENNSYENIYVFLRKDTIKSYLDYYSAGIVRVNSYSTDIMELYDSRKKVFKKTDKVSFFMIPIEIMETVPLDSIQMFPEVYKMKYVSYTKQELENLNWIITYP